MEETHASLLSSYMDLSSLIAPPPSTPEITVTSLPLPYYFFSLCNGFGEWGGAAYKTTTKKPVPLSFFVPFYMMHAYWEILVALILNFLTTEA